MKYRIALNDHNKKILVEKFNADIAKLNRDYWLQELLKDQEQVLHLLNSSFGSRDPQRRLTNRAGKLMRRYIRKITGLPRMNGSVKRIQEYRKFFKQHKFQQERQH
jgi:hypothetical protein